MRALIVGAGAVGQYLAGRLRLGGHDVTLLGRPSTVAALRSDGILLRVGNDEWPVSVGAASESSDPLVREPFELAVVAVKSYSTQDAIVSLRSTPGCAGSTIVTVQNGIGNEEALAQSFGAERIAAAALTTAVERTGPSSVTATPKGGLSFAPVGSTPHNWLLPALEDTGGSWLHMLSNQSVNSLGRKVRTQKSLSGSAT